MKFSPDSITRAIRIAQAIGSKIDPAFGAIPMFKEGEGAPLERDTSRQTQDVRMPMHYPQPPQQFAGGGEVYGDNSKIPIVGSHEGEHRLVPISPKNTNYRHVMEYVPIDWLMKHRGNEYRHSPERMEQLRNEIQEEGLREPVLISTGKNSRTSVVGEGNHRVLAAHQLGYTHIPVRAMVGSSAGNDRFPEGAHDEDIIPESNKYFPSDAKPSRVMRSLGYAGQPELPEDWWEKGYASGGAADDDEQEITGYHGSANEFPEFSMGARGRGQGQAAFGEGHNFAEDEDVAGHYRRLTAREHGEGDIVHRVTGERLPNDAPEAEMIKDASRTSSGLDHHIRIAWPNTIAFTEKQNDDAEKSRAEVNDDNWLDSYIQENNNRIKKLKSAIEIAKTHKFEPKGHMYEVGLRVNPEKLLKWHEPVDAQPEEVQRHLIENGIEYTPDWTGKDIYNRLMEHPDKETHRLSSEQYSGKRANQILSDIGVHGIQWKDTDSQIAPGSGKSNYTIWDDSRIKTRRRYALGGMPDDGRELNDFGLYSHAAEQAGGLQRTDTPENYKKMLMKLGVKPAEIEYSGYDRAFGAYPQITREQVAEHFQNNMPQMFETQYGDDPFPYERQKMLDRHNQEYSDYANEQRDNGNHNYFENPDYREMVDRHRAEKREIGLQPYEGDPYHRSHTIPGGENYREILLKHDSDYYDFGGVGNHFGGSPNIAASLRLKDRHDADGNKILHLEELQSDWGQNARKHGFEDHYRTSDALSNFKDAREEVTRAAESEDHDRIVRALKAQKKASDEYQSARSAVQRAPYIDKTDNWVDLGLKRALLEAAEKGHDKLAWTPGDVQADRYSLSKHIKELHHQLNDDGTYNIIATGRNNSTVHDQTSIPENKLAGLLGKEMAEKIILRQGDESDLDKRNASNDWQKLSGLSLDVGGEGMKTFYDQMLPKRLLKLARMHDPDAEFSKTVISHPRTSDYMSKVTELPSLNITQKMRDSILKNGFAAHADGGAVEGYDNGGGVDDHPLTNPVYHGTKSDTVSSPIASALGMEMFDANHPALNYNAPNATALALGPHVARDPNISGDMRFTTGEHFVGEVGEKRVAGSANGRVAMLNTFPDEKFFPVEQKFNDFGDYQGSASMDDQAVHNTVYSDIFQNNPKLTRKILKAMGKDPEHIEHYVRGFQSGEPFEDPLGSNGFKWPDVKTFVNSSTIPASKNLTSEVVKDFRKRMRDKGYVGLSYINTDLDETKNAKDKKCYIVFPQRDKETGWYPMRFTHGAAYNPADKGKPGLHLATGGGAGDMEDNQPPSAYFEVAPGKTWDADQQQSWEQLHPQAKAAVSNKMIGEHLSRWQRETGIHGEVRPGLGGFEGDTNPNYTFHPYDPAHIQPALHGLGTLFRQDAMMGAHTEPFPGSFPAGVVRINLPKGISEGQAHAIYTKLNQKTFTGDDGEEKSLADGHSTSLENGTMDILHGSHEESMRAAKKINALLKGKHVIESFPTNVSFPEHGADYASLSPQGGSSESSAPQANNSLQAEAAARLAELLAEAHRQGGGHKGPVSFGDTLAPGQPHPDTVSAMMPMTASSYKGPPLPGQTRNDISPSQHSPEALNAIYSRMWKQHPASGGEELPADEAKEKLLDLYTNNLLGVWDRTPPAQRQTSRFWYRAAHALGNAYAEHHDIMPRAAHAIMAVLSPQNPWDKNVTQAERVMDILKNRQDQPWTQGMSEVAYTGGSSGKGLPHDKGVIATGPHHWTDIEGKTLREVLSGPHGQKKAAMWIRAFDEAHNPTEYRAVSPTGEFLGAQMNKSGKAPDTASWNSYSPIAKAISIWHDPSLENINQQVGTNHKVREFYNNITNPNDPNVVVGDTHAVAAGEFLPHGSASKAVLHNFGSAPDTKGKQTLENEGTPWGEGDVTRSTGATGARGDYPIHAESVRRAAWQRGVHPSEMQSVTWETVRTIFKNKSTPMKRAARAIWGEYANGSLSHPETMDKIIDLATGGKGLTKPAWGSQSGQGIGNVSVGSYVKPGEIPAESPANKRYKSSGGAINKAILIAMRAKKRSPVAIK